MAIRVCLVQLPSQVREEVSAMLDHVPDLDVTGAVDSTVAALLSTRAREFDVAVVYTADGVPVVATSMVEENPSLKVVILTSNATTAYLYDLHPRLIPIAQVDGPGLAEAIRNAVLLEAS